MKLKFIGNLSELTDGIKILEKEMNFTISDDGIEVLVECVSENLIQYSLQNNKGLIRFHKKAQFFRALGLFLEAFQESKRFDLQEKPQFTTVGAMFDCSRNAVLKSESVKKIIRIMSVMGFNMLMLYTEDTYTIESEPYFGYMRGRYDYQELKDLDRYAQIFGIEMIPCIQTLAHLSSFLQWDVDNKLKDTDDILLVGSNHTYEFIEKIIASASAPFTSKRIHIGMDEAHFMGRGKYLDKFGYRFKFDIMSEHLNRVKEITTKYDLKPMIWSDMYFRLGSSGEYYDLKSSIPKDVITSIPKDVKYVYWDYYHTNVDEYQQFIQKHKIFGSLPIFAGGIWTWPGAVVHYEKTFATTNAALEACKKEGVQEVIATIWGDDGAETNMFSALLGLQLYAEHSYAGQLDMLKLKKRFRFCTGGSLQSFMNIGKLDLTPGANPRKDDGGQPDNPSKFLLWQDPLVGLFDKHIEGLNLTEYYSRLYEQLKEDFSHNQEWEFIFEVPLKLTSVLILKNDIGIRLKKYYDQRNLDKLKRIVKEDLPKLLDRIDDLRKSHRNQWFKTYKPFGWEVLDIRYGGLSARIETTIIRLSDFIDGTIDRIEELEENRLYADPRLTQDCSVGRSEKYHKIATANIF